MVKPCGQNWSGGAGLAAAMLAAAACAAPAHAATSTGTITAYYHDPALTGYTYPGPNKAELTIDVKASVGGTCGFAANGAPNGTVNAGAIDTTAWSAQVPFTAQCTAPWRIAVSSANGALKSSAAAAIGYSNAAPYTVALNVASDSGTVTGSCPVAQIDQAAGTTACNFKGTAAPTNGLLVPRSFGLAGSYIQMSAPSYDGNNGPSVLVAGTYNDTLIITVSPAS